MKGENAPERLRARYFIAGAGPMYFVFLDDEFTLVAGRQRPVPMNWANSLVRGAAKSSAVGPASHTLPLYMKIN